MQIFEICCEMGNPVGALNARIGGSVVTLPKSAIYREIGNVSVGTHIPFPKITSNYVTVDFCSDMDISQLPNLLSRQSSNY